MLVDLHLHTRLSDGHITVDDVGSIIEEGDVIALTDHNCVEAWQPLSELAKTRGFFGIPGVELRLRGRPDYLVYFSDGCNKAEIESSLDRLRGADHELSRLCFEEDFGGEAFDATFINAKRLLSSSCKFCDTRILAEMLDHHPGSALTTQELITTIRTAKGRRIDSLSGSNVVCEKSDLAYLIESEAPGWAFEFARKHKGEIVLAHPLKEVKRQGKHVSISESHRQILERICAEFATQGGHCIELCFHDEAFLRDFGYDGMKQGACDVVACARQMGLRVVCGSDLHGSVSDARNNRVSMKELRLYAEELFPDWLKAFM